MEYGYIKQQPVKERIIEKTFVFSAITMIPGEVAWIISGLNLFTSENILGLSASESGTFWYNGHGKLKRDRLANRNGKLKKIPQIEF